MRSAPYIAAHSRQARAATSLLFARQFCIPSSHQWHGHVLEPPGVIIALSVTDVTTFSPRNPTIVASYMCNTATTNHEIFITFHINLLAVVEVEVVLVVCDARYA